MGKVWRTSYPQRPSPSLRNGLTSPSSSPFLTPTHAAATNSPPFALGKRRKKNRLHLMHLQSSCTPPSRGVCALHKMTRIHTLPPYHHNSLTLPLISHPIPAQRMYLPQPPPIKPKLKIPLRYFYPQPLNHSPPSTLPPLFPKKKKKPCSHARWLPISSIHSLSSFLHSTLKLRRIRHPLRFFHFSAASYHINGC